MGLNYKCCVVIGEVIGLTYTGVSHPSRSAKAPAPTYCQRIYLGVSRRKKKDKQRRADLEMEREESEEATLPREAQGQQEALAENKGE